jgi:hypothetical protein
MRALGQKRTFGHSVDYLVGTRKQRRRDCQAERLSSPKIDDKLELCRLLDRQIGFRYAQREVTVIWSVTTKTKLVSPASVDIEMSKCALL